MQAILGWFAGEAETPEDLPVRVREFPTAVGGELLVREATLAVVNTLAPLPRRDDARAVLEREYQEWRERDEPRSARALWGLGWVEFWAGRWDVAADYAARARDISVQYGLEMRRPLPSAGSSPSTADSSTWPESTLNEVSTSLTSSSAEAPCSSWRSLASSPGGVEIRPRLRNGSRRPTGGPWSRVGRAECPLVEGSIGPWSASIKTTKASDIHVLRNRIAPGGSFGWHSHPGPSFVIVKAGEATVYMGADPTCTPRRIPAGSGFVDKGLEVHWYETRASRTS